MVKYSMSLFLLLFACTSAPMLVHQIAHHDTVGDLLQACAEGNLEKVKEEIEVKKIDPNQKTFADEGHTHRGQAAIHVASKCGKLNVLTYLIKQKKVRKEVVEGGSVCLDLDGYSPLDLAAKNNHVATVKYLLKSTKNYSKGMYSKYDNECNGKNAFHLASEKGYLGIVKIVYEKNKSWTYDKDSDGNNPLHLASLNGCFDVVKFLVNDQLLEHFINTTNNAGYTPLDVSQTTEIYNYLKDECGAVSNKWTCVII